MANEKKSHISEEEIEKMIKEFQKRWELGSVRNLVSNNMAVPDSDGKFTVNGTFSMFISQNKKGTNHTEIIDYNKFDGKKDDGKEDVIIKAQEGGYFDMNPEKQPEEQQPDK